MHVLAALLPDRNLRGTLFVLILTLAAAARAPAATVEYGQGANGDFPGFTAVQRGKGLSLHKNNYIEPLTWSPDYHGEATEIAYQISIKQRFVLPNLYFAYSQKSLWEAYNHDISAPFRETNYNPEFFYRWLPGDDMFRQWHLDEWGFDAGIEHESNGRTWPGSRSWNRVYLAPFRVSPDSLFYFKTWYRFPEPDKNAPTDAGGDDNPDIARFYGYNELTWSRHLGRGWLLSLKARANLASEKGSGELQISRPSANGDIFYVASIFSGYGETLIDYNHEVTRIGFGIMFNR